MSVLKLFEGWRTWASAVAWIAVVTLSIVSGHDLRPIAEGIGKSVGLTTPTEIDWVFFMIAANTLLALWGTTMRGWQAYKQWKAGATIGELMRAPGYAKQTVAESLVGK